MSEVLNPLTKEQKAEWIAALRSGDYKQGQGRLHREDDDSYCCLGVLAHVCAFNSGSASYLRPESYEYNPGTWSTSAAFLSETMQQSLSGMNDLADMNEEGFFEHHYSFSDIANYIEANVEAV